MDARQATRSCTCPTVHALPMTYLSLGPCAQPPIHCSTPVLTTRLWLLCSGCERPSARPAVAAFGLASHQKVVRATGPAAEDHPHRAGGAQCRHGRRHARCFAGAQPPSPALLVPRAVPRPACSDRRRPDRRQSTATARAVASATSTARAAAAAAARAAAATRAVTAAQVDTAATAATLAVPPPEPPLSTST